MAADFTMEEIISLNGIRDPGGENKKPRNCSFCKEDLRHTNYRKYDRRTVKNHYSHCKLVSEYISFKWTIGAANRQNALKQEDDHWICNFCGHDFQVNPIECTAFA